MLMIFEVPETTIDNNSTKQLTILAKRTSTLNTYKVEVHHIILQCG